MTSQHGNETTVYTAFDEAGTVIYVGITNQRTGRSSQHQRTSEWWPFHSRQEVEHCATRTAALIREGILIRRYCPPFNKQHNPHWERIRRQYLASLRPGQHGPEAALRLAEALGWAVPLKVTGGRAMNARFEAHADHRIITSNWAVGNPEVTDETGQTVGRFRTDSTSQGKEHLVVFLDVLPAKDRPTCCRVSFTATQKPGRFYVTAAEVSTRWPAPWLAVAS